MGQLLVIKQLGHLNQISLVVELGRAATNAYQSNFIGSYAGYNATDASFKFLWFQAGNERNRCYLFKFLWF
jgi:hypothetical protein